MLVVVNLDPSAVREDTLWLDLGLSAPYEVHDELNDLTYTWTGNDPYVRIDPAEFPAHVFSVKAK